MRIISNASRRRRGCPKPPDLMGPPCFYFFFFFLYSRTSILRVQTGTGNPLRAVQCVAALKASYEPLAREKKKKNPLTPFYLPITCSAHPIKAKGSESTCLMVYLLLNHTRLPQDAKYANLTMHIETMYTVRQCFWALYH